LVLLPPSLHNNSPLLPRISKSTRSIHHQSIPSFPFSSQAKYTAPLFRIHRLLQADAQLFPQRLQLLEVLVVLALVLDLSLKAYGSFVSNSGSLVPAMLRIDEQLEHVTFEDSHRGREVVDSPGGPQRGGDDGGRGHEVVGEGVVQVPLR